MRMVRHAGWKFTERETNGTLKAEQVLHISINRLSGATLGTSLLHPLIGIPCFSAHSRQRAEEARRNLKEIFRNTIY
jgi:hypothetical protein